MKKFLPLIPLLLAALTSTSLAQQPPAVQVTGNVGYSFTTGMSAVNTHTFRASIRFNGTGTAFPTTFVLNPNATIPYKGTDDNSAIQTENGKLHLSDPYNLTLSDSTGKALLNFDNISPPLTDPKTGNPFISITLSAPAKDPQLLYGSGNAENSLTQTKGNSHLGNGKASLPYFWSSAGYGCLIISADDNTPASFSQSENQITLTIPGTGADLYLFPAKDLKQATQYYAELTGLPPVPPRWSLGYLQSRWGWQDQAYIEDTLKQFTTRHLPIDAFIFDFEWYTPKPDYTLTPAGLPDFNDFSFNPTLFPNPAAQIQTLHDAGLHVIGIRKPRIGNSTTLAMIRQNHWDMPHESSKQKYDARTLNFASPDARQWYTDQLKPLLDAGLDAWWNDEGELTYTTYYYWNLAEQSAQQKFRPNSRLFTINRAFSPGLARLGAAAWTGDIDSSWASLQKTPTDLLNWSLAGMPYPACDIGGFKQNDSPQLLTRWMQAAALFPIMRAHSSLKITPRFPWLYGPEAETNIKSALQLRYRLLPTLYSLAHQTHTTGLPLMRPLLMEFPTDPNVTNLSDQWLLGESILAAPILTESNTRQIYFPDTPNGWYKFDTNEKITGNQTQSITASLAEIPLYIRAGSILPLAPPIEHTSQLPNGPLHLQIYPGQDVDFTLTQDDGTSQNYLSGNLRQTTFHWQNSTQTLTWTSTGPYTGKDLFTTTTLTLFSTPIKKSPTLPLPNSGTYTFNK